MAQGHATNGGEEATSRAGWICAGVVRLPADRLSASECSETAGQPSDSASEDRVPCAEPINGAIVPIVTRLARQLHAGDLSALGRLYDVAATRLARYAHTLAGNTHDAEDSLQACMIRLAENPRRVASARHPWAYCLKVLRNETLRVVAGRQPTRSLTHLDKEPAADLAPIALDDQTNFIRQALRRLPPEQTEVVVLKIWENMTFLEIAEIVGESANTVASRYRYALEKLSRSLRPLVEVCHD